MWYLERPVISQIREFLFLGNQLAAQNEGILRAHGIKRVVSVVEQPSRMPSSELCEKLDLWHTNFRVMDDEFEDEAEELTSRVLPWISESEKSRQPILIHCHASVSRSPSLVIAYLIWRGLDFENALNLTSIHPSACPKPQVLRSFIISAGFHFPERQYLIWHAKRVEFLHKYGETLSR